jgi:hypothetical protein
VLSLLSLFINNGRAIGVSRCVFRVGDSILYLLPRWCDIEWGSVTLMRVMATIFIVLASNSGAMFSYPPSPVSLARGKYSITITINIWLVVVTIARNTRTLNLC